MSEPRLRIFAGPNGSGKSTLFETFSQKYNAGFFLNADLFEKELSTKGVIDLSEYGLELSQSDLDIFLKTDRIKSLMNKASADHNPIDICIKENIIVDIEKESHSYEGALVSAFMRHHLMLKKADYSFETVMSHPSKIEEIGEAKERGYKIYLYFICIDDPEVNISRVENRVEKGGHAVEPEKIERRYKETLENLNSAIEKSDKVYLFDNSAEEFRLIAKIKSGKLTLETDPKELPIWFINYVLPYYL